MYVPIKSTVTKHVGYYCELLLFSFQTSSSIT